MFALHDKPKGSLQPIILIYWGQVTHIWVDDSTIVGPDNGLPPGGHQAIIWTNAGIFLNRLRGTNFSETLTKLIHFFNSRKCIWKCRRKNGGLNAWCIAYCHSRVIDRTQQKEIRDALLVLFQLGRNNWLQVYTLQNTYYNFSRFIGKALYGHIINQ